VGACLAGLLALGAWPGPARSEAPEDWPGAFHGTYGFFFGGGVGGGLARTKRPDETRSRYTTSLPLNFRAGFDLGRYGLALLVDTQYSFHWGPAWDQGPRPANRQGTLQLLSVGGSILFRPIGPLYFSFGAGVALPGSGQDIFSDPASARAELLAAVGFLYRLPRKKESETRGSHYPLALSVSIESRYYLPWDERFLNYSLLAVMTFYFVFNAR
jgi:hypothetical protein